MASIREIYPDTYLRPKHLQGRTCPVTITGVTIQKFWNPRKNAELPAFVVTMKGKKLPFILNKTQTLAIATILDNEDYTQWNGGSICLKAGTAPNGKPTIVITAPEATEPPPTAPAHPDAAAGEQEPHPDAEDDAAETHPDAEAEQAIGDE